MKRGLIVAICIALSGCDVPSGNYLFAEQAAAISQDDVARPAACRQIGIDIAAQQKQAWSSSSVIRRESADAINGLEGRSIALRCTPADAVIAGPVTNRTAGLTECIADCYERSGRQHGLCQRSCVP